MFTLFRKAQGGVRAFRCAQDFEVIYFIIEVIYFIIFRFDVVQNREGAVGTDTPTHGAIEYGRHGSRGDLRHAGIAAEGKPFVFNSDFLESSFNDVDK